MSYTIYTENPDTITSWIGIHQVYPKSVWGYLSDGADYNIFAPFITWKNPRDDDYKCAGVSPNNVMSKVSCIRSKSYICEAGTSPT